MMKNVVSCTFTVALCVFVITHHKPHRRARLANFDYSQYFGEMIIDILNEDDEFAYLIRIMTKFTLRLTGGGIQILRRKRSKDFSGQGQLSTFTQRSPEASIHVLLKSSHA